MSVPRQLEMPCDWRLLREHHWNTNGYKRPLEHQWYAIMVLLMMEPTLNTTLSIVWVVVGALASAGTPHWVQHYNLTPMGTLQLELHWVHYSWNTTGTLLGILQLEHHWNTTATVEIPAHNYFPHFTTSLFTNLTNCRLCDQCPVNKISIHSKLPEKRLLGHLRPPQEHLLPWQPLSQ